MILYFLRHGESQNNYLDMSGDREARRSSEPDLTTRGLRQAERTAELFAYARSLRQAQSPVAERTGQIRENAPAPVADAIRLAVPGGEPNAYNPYRGSSFDITHIYASPHLRALRTSTPIAQLLDMPVHVYEDIHEAGGVFEHDRTAGVYRGAQGLSRAEAEGVYGRFVFPDHLSKRGWWSFRPFETEEERVLRANRVREQLVKAHGPDDHILLVSHTHFHVYFICSILGLPYRDGYWITLNNCAITRINFDVRGVRIEYMNRQDHLLPDLLG